MSLMSIDPRTLEQLLRLQMTSKLNFNANDSAADSTDSTDASFGGILQQLLDNHLSASTPNKTNGTSPASTASLLASGNFGFYPPAPSSPTAYDSLIDQSAGKYGVDSSLIKSVINAESSFNPHAVSSSGAKGLMQLMDGTGAGLGVTDPFDPQQNIDAGTHFLSDLLKQYSGSEATALAAYNAGPGRLASLGIANEQQLIDNYKQLPQETQNYVPKVLRMVTR